MSWFDIIKNDMRTLIVRAIKSGGMKLPSNSQADVLAAKWVIDNPEKTADALVAMKPAVDYWEEIAGQHRDGFIVADMVVERFYMDIKELIRDVEAERRRRINSTWKSKGDLE